MNRFRKQMQERGDEQAMQWANVVNRLEAIAGDLWVVRMEYDKDYWDIVRSQLIPPETMDVEVVDGRLSEERNIIWNESAPPPSGMMDAPIDPNDLYKDRDDVSKTMESLGYGSTPPTENIKKPNTLKEDLEPEGTPTEPMSPDMFKTAPKDSGG